MFIKLSDRDAFGRPNKYRSLSEAGLLGYGNNSYTKALLHGDGDDESTSIVNNARGGSEAWTASGGAEIDTASKVFGSGSIYLPNGSAKVEADIAAPAGDFSVDFRLRLPASSSNYANGWGYGNDPVGSGILMYGEPRFAFYIKNGSGLFEMPCTAFSGDVFHHFIITRNGNTFSIWIDGALDVSDTYAGAFLDFGLPMKLGGSANGGFTGHIEELRYTDGVDITSDSMDPCYSANGTTYTVPTKAYK